MNAEIDRESALAWAERTWSGLEEFLHESEKSTFNLELLARLIARVMVAEVGDIAGDSDLRAELERVAAYGFAGGAMDALYDINPMAMRRQREERHAMEMN